MSKLLNTSQFINTINSRHHTKPQALGKTFGYKGCGLRREAASQHHRVTSDYIEVSHFPRRNRKVRKVVLTLAAMFLVSDLKRSIHPPGTLNFNIPPGGDGLSLGHLLRTCRLEKSLKPGSHMPALSLFTAVHAYIRL